ncbi:MAG: hypothetical protein IPM57_08175 [Oligoflexia bacterium]|nr:hypothetical protein [Oligoflexia bacterium]
MENLKKILTISLKKLEKITDNFPIEDKDIYALWLAQTYYFVCHSTRLLAHGAALFDFDHNTYHYRYADRLPGKNLF